MLVVYVSPASFVHSSAEEFDNGDGKEVVDYYYKLKMATVSILGVRKIVDIMSRCFFFNLKSRCK